MHPIVNMASYNNKDLLTPSEVALSLRLDLLTIYKYIRNRSLQAIKFGRKYRIKQADLDRFIKSKRTY